MLFASLRFARRRPDFNKTPTRSNLSPEKLRAKVAAAESDRTLMRIQSFGEMLPRLSKEVDRSFEGNMNMAVMSVSMRNQNHDQNNNNGNVSNSSDWQSDILDSTSSHEQIQLEQEQMQMQHESHQKPRAIRNSSGKKKRNSQFDTPTKETQDGTETETETEGSSLFSTPNDMAALKQRQESRKEARRALSANTADERKSRPKISITNAGVSNMRGLGGTGHGPGTPVAVGKYKSDGSRTNIHTTDVHPNPLDGDQSNEDRPIKPMESYNGGGADSRFDDDGDGGNGNDLVGVISGSPNNSSRSNHNHNHKPTAKVQTVSLATRRRLERQQKKEQKQKEEQGSSSYTLDDEFPQHKVLSSQSSLNATKQSPRTNRNRAQTDTKVLEKNTISFSGNEHVSSSLRAESHDYLTTDDLRPSPNPTQEVQRMLGGIGTDEWPEIFHTLNSVRRLAIHHGNLIEGHVHTIVRSVIKAVDNLRSAVSKNAILTLEDMWIGMGKSMDPEVVAVTPLLLKRAADLSGFLTEGE